MMAVVRFTLLLAAVISWHMTALGEDFADLQAKVDAKASEIASLSNKLMERKQSATRFETDLARLQASTSALEQQKAQALKAMQEEFQRIIADPGLDLTSAQTAYRDAFAALQQHQKDIESKQAEIETTREEIALAQRDADKAERSLAEVRLLLDVARAERLYRELNAEGSIQISSTISCKQDETIAACMGRGAQAAKEEAKQRFNERIYVSLTETDVVAQHRDKVKLVPTVIESKITNSGFSGQGDYSVELDARMRGEPSRADACTLLGLDAARCKQPALAQQLASSATDATPTLLPEGDNTAAAVDTNYTLTVRSNLNYDEVYIDGESYGSTRLDVVLPTGEYDIEVRKPGYQSFKRRVKLDQDRTVVARLAHSG